jgi:Tfp pilus assembly protein PilN
MYWIIVQYHRLGTQQRHRLAFAWVIGGGALLVICLLYATGLYGIRSLMDE